MAEESNRFELSEDEFAQTLREEAETRIPVIQRLAEGKKTPTCVIVVGMAGSGKVRLCIKTMECIVCLFDSCVAHRIYHIPPVDNPHGPTPALIGCTLIKGSK